MIFYVCEGKGCREIAKYILYYYIRDKNGNLLERGLSIDSCEEHLLNYQKNRTPDEITLNECSECGELYSLLRKETPFLDIYKNLN